MEKIKKIVAREILDSRGFPALEVDTVLANGFVGRAAVPSGASTGKFEALELRDNDARFNGKGLLTAIRNVEDVISKAVIGEKADYAKIDDIMLQLDGTPNKTKLGANAILGVSLSVAKAAAKSAQLPLYNYLGITDEKILPVPLINILNGGMHADNNLDIQEFMIVPSGFDTFSRAIRAACEIFQSLKIILHNKKLPTTIGDEGGFAPNITNTSVALSLVVDAIDSAGYIPGKDVFIALDVAASSFYRNGNYFFEGENISADALIAYYDKLIASYPIISIEDGLDEEDWDGWQILTNQLGAKIQIVGDDLFVTNKARLARGIQSRIANSILIKLNQIGTLSETLDAISLASGAGYASIISHRSGETEDVSIAHLAVAVGCGRIKSGSVSRTERTAKYNELLRIEAELDGKAVFYGRKIA